VNEAGRPFELDRDTEVEREDGHWTGRMAQGWMIGQNPHGGYLACVILRALQIEADRPEPLTMSALFVSAPRLGAVRVETELIKAGRTYTSMSGRLLQDGRERVRVLAAFGDITSIQGPTRLELTPPALPPPGECVDLNDLVPELPLNDVDHRYELRSTPEDLWVRQAEPVIAGWIRFRDGRPADSFSLPFFADAFPPPVIGLDPAAWVPTLELTVHVRARPSGGWLLGRYRSVTLLNGLLGADIDLWDETGRLVAMARQLALVLPP
jgi:hypothetical protein